MARINSEPPPLLEPREGKRLPDRRDPPCGPGTLGSPLQLCSAGEASVEAELQSRPLGLSLGTGDFEGWMWLHSEWQASLWKAQRKAFVIREGDRAGVTSPSLMSEWPLSCPPLPGQGHGVDGAEVTPCHPHPSVFERWA